MTNLLNETIGVIEELNKTSEDIDFIGSDDGEYACDWLTFNNLANVEYDSGFGGNEVASNLVILFKDGTWLSRGEYDGSEWWDYNVAPKKSPNARPVTNVMNVDYNDEVS